MPMGAKALRTSEAFDSLLQDSAITRLCAMSKARRIPP